MSHAFVTRPQASIRAQVNQLAGVISSFLLAAAASIVLIVDTVVESFNPVRLGAALVVLILLQLLRYRRLVFCREFALYALFVACMFLSLLWAPDLLTGMNTLLPAVNFVLVLIFFAALLTYHDPVPASAGALCGFLAGAAVYTVMQGFPFSYPEGFSYNAIAGMYLFGLFITLVFGWSARSRFLPLLIGLILLAHIAATTSIKTNLGILLGLLGVALMYFRNFTRVLWRNAIPVVALVGAAVYVAARDDALVERVRAGLERVAVGVEILSNREDTSSATSFGEREYWMVQGLRGWLRNPLFGSGVEAFRADYGITSHSTPIDLLYNHGLIGLVVFYSIFLSIGWRLLHTRETNLGNLRALILAAFICYLFISLSGTMHYNYFLAVFIAISVAFLRRDRREFSEIGP